MSLEELNELEFNFLLLLDFNTFIDDNTYEEYIEQLKNFTY